jgi:hypothetical protein
MNISEIVEQLRDERSKLDAAIQALEGVGGAETPKRRGRPPGNAKKPTPVASPRKRRGMRPAARKRLAEAMRKRWAAAKKSGKRRL